MTGKMLILVGVILISAGVFFGYSNYSFVSSAVKTEARVKNIIKGHRSITPVFEFTVNGKTYQFEGASTKPDSYKIGDNETIYYNPADPEDHKTGTFMNLWFLPVFLTGFGLIVLPVGIGLAFSKKNNPVNIKYRPG